MKYANPFEHPDYKSVTTDEFYFLFDLIAWIALELPNGKVCIKVQAFLEDYEETEKWNSKAKEILKEFRSIIESDVAKGGFKLGVGEKVLASLSNYLS